MDLPSLGYQEYAVIFLPFFLLGLLRGWRTAGRPRAERIRTCLRVSPGVGIAVLAVYGFVGILTFLYEREFRRLVEGIFGLPFMLGVLLWPQRRKPDAPG
jgi:hypothetical protein